MRVRPAHRLVIHHHLLNLLYWNLSGVSILLLLTFLRPIWDPHDQKIQDKAVSEGNWRGRSIMSTGVRILYEQTDFAFTYY